jgi:hypothetical protein
MAHEADADVQLEPAGVSLRPVLWAALGSIALILAAILGLNAVYEWWVPSRTVPAPEQFPSPRVQTHQAEQRQELLAAQRRQLAGYAWVDSGKTLVRVPIERAMDIIAQRGAKAYAPLTAHGQTAVPAAGSEPTTTGQGSSRNHAIPGLGGNGLGTGERPPNGRPPRRRKH